MNNPVKFSIKDDAEDSIIVIGLTYTDSDFGMDIGICNFVYTKSLFAKNEDTIVEMKDRLVQDLNDIIHSDNNAKRLLKLRLLQDLSSSYRKFKIDYNCFVNGRYEQFRETEISNKILRLLRDNRPNNGRHSSLYDIVEILFKNDIKTYP